MNILLAEDEPPILRDIQAQLEHLSEYPLHIQTARHGKQALELLSNAPEPFDLLITDIDMPIMSGLELIEHAKERYPRLTCVILTGYSDFEYAKQAIHLGVTEYLLKPVEEEALSSLILRTLSEKHRTRLEQTMKDATPPALETPAVYQTAIICIGTLTLHSHEYNVTHARQWQELNLNQMVERLKCHYTEFLIADGKTNSEKNLITILKDQKSSSFLRELHRLCASFPFPVSIAYHKENITMNDISLSFHQLRQLLSRELIVGKSLLLDDASPKSNSSETNIAQISQLTTGLTALFAALQLKPFEIQFLKLIRLFQTIHCPQHLVFYHLHKLVRNSLETHHLENILYFDCVDCIWDSMALSDSFAELYENMISVFRDLFDQIYNRLENNLSKESLMYLMEAYIKEHYHQPMNAQTLADEYHFTPAYLSKLFREYKNLSPTDYITELRICKAKELLSGKEGLKIREISALVGYEDPLYFSKVFKKITGHTPREYLTSKQEKNFRYRKYP